MPIEVFVRYTARDIITENQNGKLSLAFR